MDHDDDRPLAGKTCRRPGEKAVDDAPIEAFPGDGLHAAEARGVEAGHLVLGPAFDAVVAHIDRVGIAGALRAGDGHREIARILVPHGSLHRADR